MAGFFKDQCFDSTGRQAVKLEKYILIALAIYLVHIVLSFFITAAYSTSLIGPIFSLAGLLVGIGILGSYKRDHTMTCVYIGVLALELVLGIIGTVLWVVQGVVISTTKLTVIGGPDQRSKTALYVSVAIAASTPLLILVNLYCLVLAAKLKMALKVEKKQHRAMAIEERVLLLVEEIITQQLQLAPLHALPKPHPHRTQSNEPHRTQSKQPHRSKSTKHKQKQPESTSAPAKEVHVDIPEASGSSAM